MKRCFAVMLAAVCIFCMASCGKKEAVTPAAQKQQEITLLFSQTDSLDPYSAKTEPNRHLATLIFDSLYKVDKNFRAVPCLAVTCEQKDTVFTVHLGAFTFTDGTNLSSADVVYSFEKARQSATSGYAAALSEVESIAAVDPATVRFSLNRFDPYFLNLLTFPILKTDSAGLTDSDGVEIPPIGCGRYIPDTANLKLIRNDNYHDTLSVIKQINLISAPDSESASHYVQMGACDLYYTSSETNIVRMSGKRSEIDINHLVFLGVNSSYGALGNKEMRYAISSLIDRADIVSSAYYNAAVVANGFFNPALSDVKSTSTIKQNADTDISIENLAKIGYTNKDEDGYYVSSSGTRASFSLLVNQNNPSRMIAARHISTAAKSAGIEITGEPGSFETYLSRIKAGHFQLYLGEVAIGLNMDIKGLVVPGGSAAFGVSDTSGGSSMSISGAVKSYEEGSLNLSSLSGVLLTEMPQIPICYRKGSLFYSDKIKSGVNGLSCDIYYNMADYKF